MSKFDNDILNEVLTQGASGNLGEIMGRAILKQAEREAFVKSHRGLILAVTWTLAILSLVWLATIALVIVGIIGALLTLVAWQTAGIFLGIALIGTIVNFAAVKPIDKRFSPLLKTFIRVRKAEKEAKAQA